MENEAETSSLRQRRKKSLSISSCFNCRPFESIDSSSSSAPSPSAHLKRSPSAWFRSKTHELPEIKGKCKNLMWRMGRHRRHSADFSYDPLSYALNFEDDDPVAAEVEEFPLRNFAARLPALPRTPKVVTPREKVEMARLPLSPQTTTGAQKEEGMRNVDAAAAAAVVASRSPPEVLVEIG